MHLASNDSDENPFVLALDSFVDSRENKRIAIPDNNALPPIANDVDWLPTAAGSYEGLLYAGTALSGSVTNLKVTAPRIASTNGGSVTATVRLNGVTSTLRGSFNSAGQLTSELGANPAFDLHLQQSSKGFLIRGTITRSGVTANAWLPQTPYSKSFPVPPAGPATGPYTLLLPSAPGWGEDQPGGDGWATANLSSTGAFSLTGALGDGTKFTETGYLSADNEISLYADLYAKSSAKGFIGGQLVFRDLTGSDLDGALQWHKGKDTRATLYPTGFDESVHLIGARFVAPAANSFVLSQLSNQHYNAELSLIGPTAPATVSDSLDKVLSWLTSNKLVHYGEQSLSGQASARNGSITGSFTDPLTKARIAFAGVVLQKQGIAGGVFVNRTASGALRILPGTDFKYPGSETAPTLARLTNSALPAGSPQLSAQSSFPPAAAGTYWGTLKSPADQVHGGLEAGTLTSTGTISGTLWIDGVRQSLRAIAGQATTLVDGSIVTLNVALIDGVTDGYVLQGSVSINGAVSALLAERLPAYTVASPSPWKAAYTLAVSAPSTVEAMTEPGGDGYGTVTVAAAGTCTGQITLADGTKVTLGGHAGSAYTDNGATVASWSFHRGLYGKTPKGYLAGKLTFRLVDGLSDLDGDWRWVKQNGALPAAIYPEVLIRHARSPDPVTPSRKRALGQCPISPRRLTTSGSASAGWIFRLCPRCPYRRRT